MGHGSGFGDGGCIDWHQRHIVRVFSAPPSCLRGVHYCGGRHGIGSRLGLLGLFVLGFFF